MVCRTKLDHGAALLGEILPTDPSSVLCEATLSALYALAALTQMAFHTSGPDVIGASGVDIPMPYWGLGLPSGSGSHMLHDVYPRLYSPFASFRHATLASALVDGDGCGDVVLDVKRLNKHGLLTAQPALRRIGDSELGLCEGAVAHLCDSAEGVLRTEQHPQSQTGSARRELYVGTRSSSSARTDHVSLVHAPLVSADGSHRPNDPFAPIACQPYYFLHDDFARSGARHSELDRSGTPLRHVGRTMLVCHPELR